MAPNLSIGSALARLRWDKPRPSPEVDLTTLGGRIKAARCSRGLTLKQLGELVGADSAQIWKYEASRQFPTKTRLAQLVEALGEGILEDKKETSP